MGRAPHVLLLVVVVGAVYGPVAGFVGDDEPLRLRIDGELTQHLFALPTVKRTLQEHSRRLESRQTSVAEIQSRLDAIEASQKLANEQLAGALQRLEAIAQGTTTAHSGLAEVAVAKAGTAAAVDTLSSDLGRSIADMAETVAGLVSSQTAQHGQTRGLCQRSGESLSAALTELRTAVSRLAELARRTEAAVGGGLQRAGGLLQEMTQQLERVGQEQRWAPPTTAAPPPTEDPLRQFLDSLNASLGERRPTTDRNGGSQ